MDFWSGLFFKMDFIKKVSIFIFIFCSQIYPLMDFWTKMDFWTAFLYPIGIFMKTY